MDLMIFDNERRASGYFCGEIDMEIGDSSSTNDFVVDDTIQMGEYIAEIGGEFGGVIERFDNDVQKTYTGHTWRGLLNKWILEPPQGGSALVSRLIVSGDLNDILRAIAKNILGSFFGVAEGRCGVEADKYVFPLYCTALDGILGLCESYGCKLVIKNTMVNNHLKVMLSAETAKEKTLSENAFSATTTISNMGINHLICIGTADKKNEDGEEVKLQGNTRLDLYMHPNGTISLNPYYKGFLERQAYYMHDSSESILESGKKRLRELANYKRMDIETINTDADIGDKLKAKKDGITITKPVVRKILTGRDGSYAIECELKGE